MKNLHNIIRFLIIFSILFFIAGTVSAVTRGVHIVSKKGKELYLYKDYHALVVGVSDYDKWPDLPNAVKDAREVASTLKGIGFNVKLLLNPTSDGLQSALRNMAFGLGKEENRALLFYFAGHGETLELADNTELGYIIPSDCPLKNRDPLGFDDKAISMKVVESYALKAKSKHLLMVFDSCFSGSLFNLVRAAPVDITEKSARPVRQFITGGGAGEQVPDRSTFKVVFLDGVKGEADLNSDGYVTGSELGMHLQEKVVNYTRGGQHPQYGKINNPKLDKGDFIFILAGAEPPPDTTAISVSSNVEGATVRIDGDEKGQTPLFNVLLPAGSHRVVVSKEGYTPYRKTVTVELGRSLSVTANLTQSTPRTGRLYVDKEPDDARIRILNIASPYHRGIELTAGRYHVEVSASDHETKKEWIDLAAGEDKYIDVRLIKRHAAVAAPAQVTGEPFTNSMGMKFVPIPTGTFMMGSPSNEPKRKSDEKQHRVTLTKGFYMGTTEVTQGQWKAIMGNNPARFKGDNNPVEQVSWNDAKEFIRKLNRKEGTNTYRLPTEAEWEYACRAGTTTPFSTGRCISTDQANYNGNYPMPGCSKGRYRKETIRVASLSPNVWGLYDMHGNVHEWCEDWYEKDYPSGHVTDPKGSSSGSARVLRGGSWCYDAGSLRSALRSWDNPGDRYNGIGFRVVRAD